MTSAFLVLGMTWGPRAGALLRAGTPELQEQEVFGKEERKRALEKCSGQCWRAHTRVKANRSAAVTPGPSLPKKQQVGTRCTPCKQRVGFTVTKQLQ